jgi:hypothetical protein
LAVRFGRFNSGSFNIIHFCFHNGSCETSNAGPHGKKQLQDEENWPLDRQIRLCSILHSGFRGADMRAQLLVLAIATPIYCFGQVNLPAMAQAGSTGGTVGKQDKSASGGEEPAKPKSHSHKLASRPAADKSKSSGCGNVAGTYKWVLGTSTVIKADGTAAHSTGPQGKWTCTDGQVVIVWNNGYIDRLTPTPSGFSAVNNFGMQFEAVRM